MAIDAPDRAAPVGLSLPAWTRPGRPATALAVAAVVLAAVLFDIATRSQSVGISASVLVASLAGVLFAAGHLRNPQSRALAIIAVIFGAFFIVRTSPWLLTFDVLVSGGCLVAAASLAQGGSLLDISAPKSVLRALHAGVNGLFGLGYITRGRGTRLAPVMRGLAIAVPLTVVIGLLFSAGDAVFASAFRFDTGDLFAHVALLFVGLWLAAGLARVSAASPMDEPKATMPRLGAVEWAIVLGALNLLYLGFAVARIVAVSEGGSRVLETAGLTYAEYARSGFFELLGAAAITLVALIVVRATADVSESRSRRLFLVLACSLIALNLLVVGSAFQRLALYEQAFGLSMLRLYSMVFCIWLAIALVALALWIVGVGSPRPWFWSVAAASALALLFALNIANPEAIVVRHNAGADTVQGFDAEYAIDLSADAVPALVDAARGLEGNAQAEITSLICNPYLQTNLLARYGNAGEDSWAAFNASRSHAIDVLDSFCDSS